MESHDLRDFTLDSDQIIVSTLKLHKVVEQLSSLDTEIRNGLLSGNTIPILAKIKGIKTELTDLILDGKWDEDESTSEII